MDWLNYNHLLYFWAVAREGGVARAAAKLRRSQPTISAQIHELEDALGEKLFTRTGRRLELTETGRQALQYADDIFSLGQELIGMVKGRPLKRPLRLMVGVADVLPKLVVHALLEPAMRFPEPLQMVCREDKPERLLAELSLHELDVVLSDAPASSPAVKVRAFSHLLGECGVTFFGAARYKFLRKDFPQSLDGTPILVPTGTASLRHSLDQWFEKLRIRPTIWGEFDDSALLQIFGQAGLGVFAAPSAIQAQIRHTHGVHVIGRTEDIRERFYAISAERKLQHPAVVAISESAKNKLFS